MVRISTVARYVFSAALLIAVLYLIGTNDILEAIAGANASYVPIALLFAFGTHYCAAIRLRTLLAMQRVTLTILRVFSISLSAVFYGLIVPGGTLASSAARFIHLSRDAPYESVGAALIVDRVLATVFLVVLGAIAIAIDRAESAWMAAILIAPVLVLSAFVVARHAYVQLAGRFGRGASGGLRRKLQDALERIGAALTQYASIGTAGMVSLALTSVLAHLCGFAAFYFTAIAMGMDISFLTVCWVRAVMVLAAMLPVTVAGIGVREVSGIGMLVPLGFSEAEAVAYSLVAFIVTQLALGIVGGCLEARRVLGRRALPVSD